MKTAFVINPLIVSILEAKGFNVTGQNGIQQACEAYLGSMQVTSEKAERSALKEKKSGITNTQETLTIAYQGKRNDVSAFIAWNDVLSSMQKRGAKYLFAVSVTGIPEGLIDWLNRFTAKPAPKAGKNGKGQTVKK